MILAPITFNIFVNFLHGGSGCTLNKFGRDAKLGGVVNRPVIQLDCNKLEKWPNRSVVMFHKRRYQVLHQGRDNPRLQYMLGTRWMESIFAEKDLGILVNKQPDLAVCFSGKSSQQPPGLY